MGNFHYENVFNWDKLTEKQKFQVDLTYEEIMARLAYKSPVTMTLDQWLESMLTTGRCIYECKTPELFTGLYSWKAIQKWQDVGLSKANLTPEHAMGRHRTAHKLQDALANNPSMSLMEFRKLFASLAFYHKVLPEENNSVKKYIDAGYDWITAYELAGISLYYVVYARVGSKKVIKEMHYMSPSELKKHFAY